MHRNIYLENGYLDIMPVMLDGSMFTTIIGGRGTGKTYSVLKYLVDSGERFIYLRRSATQIDTLSSDALNPFNAINPRIKPFPESAHIYSFYKTIESDKPGKWDPVGLPLGIGTSLSTFAKLRGASLEDIDILLFDEFIKQPEEREIKREATAFFNMIETIQRNRELTGKKPLKVILLGNSNTIFSPILAVLRLIQPLGNMITEKVEYRSVRGMNLYVLMNSPISAEKSKSELYRLTSGSDFYRMAISTDFGLDGLNIHKFSDKYIRNFVLYATIGELAIYQHKSKVLYYCTSVVSGKPRNTYDFNQFGLQKFSRDWKFLLCLMYSNDVQFSEFSDYVNLTNYVKCDIF